jgi:general nucleoside transport system ATP-binding protein
MRVDEAAHAIEMRGITKRFAAVVANEGIDFAVRAGEVHALVGENGAGKSTLMSILAGLYQPDEGEILVDGEPVRFHAPRDAIAHGVGMVYQHFMLIEPFTVAENLMLGLPGNGRPVERLDTSGIERDIADLSARYGLEVDPNARIWQLSVGEQQRVEILRLLHRGARILVLDEPTAVLTPQEARALIATLRAMAAQGFGIVFISHKLDEVLQVADRVTVLRRGRTVATVEPANADRHALARLMVGRDLAALVDDPAHHEARRRPLGAERFVVTDLRAMGDRGLPALNGVTFSVRAGEVLGIAGVAGNGQRELAEALTGLRHITGGEVVLDGQRLTNQPTALIAEAGVAHIPEDRLATGLVGSMNLTENAILRRYRKRPLSRGPFILRNRIGQFAETIVRNYDVQPAKTGVRAALLSGGNQQKLIIGRELAGEPTVIVAMHPTRGVDVGATETIHRLLMEQRDRGAAILLIAEDLDELIALSDRIAVIYDGRITGEVDAIGADPAEIGVLMTGGGAHMEAAS